MQGSPYHGTDPNAAGYLPSRMAGAADQAVSDAIEGENGGILRKGAAFVYRGAANAADNLARMAVSSAIGGPALGMGVNSAFSFTQGFQSSYREAQEKGGSPIQGMLVGSVDGGMEVFTESRTFERWMNLKDPELIGEGVYEWLKTAAVGVGNEITEEEASYIANTIADAVIMADKSESAEYIKSAVEEGKTPAQARWELVKKYAHEMAVTAADTAISTLLMDGVTGAVANYQYKKTYGGSSAELVQEGLESPEGTQSRTLAEKYQKKLDSGKTLSGAELQRLVNANEIQIAAEEMAASEQEKEEQPSSFQNPTPEAETGAEEAYTPKSTLESLSEKYGAYAGAMRENYLEGQDVEEYDRAFQTAYDMGKSGLNKDALSRVETLGGLIQSQREIAYEIGQAAADSESKAQSSKNAAAANGKTGWHKGAVRGEGVKIADLTRTFNDPQRKAYSALSTIAEATGIDIVLYKSQANEDGEFQGEQGRFNWSDNTIYIDINAGLNGEKDVGNLAKYTMLRTYGHEFTHFIEKWNPEQYNDFRKAVFSTMENPEDLIETRMAQDSTGNMTYDQASREVVAEAMTDILEDSQFIQQLAEKHTSVFETLRSKLKEFVENLKIYFKSLAKNGAREAKQLKKEVGDSISYLEGIVKQFDEIAVQAVENYQRTVAEDEAGTIAMEESSAPSAQKETDTSFEEVFWNATPEERKEVVDAIDENMGGPTRMYPTELPALEPEETVSENAIEPPSVSRYDGFSVTSNTERGTLEIRFDRKPAQNVLNLLKENKFRWSSKNRLWYGNGDIDEISKIISNHQTSETTTVNNSEEGEQNAETDVHGQEESDGALREDHPGGVPESEQSGEGTARLLDEPQEGALQQHDQGAAADDSGGGRTETGRSGSGPDSERDGRSGGTGSGAVSDLRRDADVTPDDGGISETVQREIEQKSTGKPKGENYAIGDSLNLAKGEKARYRDNVAALRLIHQLNQEGRFATKEEQEVLSKYVGWGGLDGAFGELAYNRETRKSEMRAKSGWEKEFQELRQLVTDGVLTEEEYRGMSESTKNAHYTSMEVISAMYDGLKKLGFQGGRMLEPSSGVGNFVGGMPADMTSSVKSWTMVELDRVTGQIAKYLYPNNDVRIEGFQDANIPNDYMDVAIGNVPFGNYGVVDRTYPKRVTKSIHNYFFAKSIDKVRPGGLVMFITSSFTMNSQDNAIRQYLMDRADLLGAIRLPNTAFKGNAGTDVVTDILILKKRVPGTAYSGETFLEAPQKSIPGSWRTVNINEYFSAHPEMVLGKETVTRGMYGAETLTYAPLEDAGSLGDQIRSAFDKITGKMDYVQESAQSVQKSAEKAVRKPKEGVYRRAQDGTITNGSGVAVTNADTAKRIGGMIDIRDAYRNLVERIQQGRTKEEIAKARKYLNRVYDSFVKENGLINDPKNKKAFEEDPYRFSLFALETDYQKGGKGKPSTAKKADIFTKDTIKANVTVTHAESVSDGLIVSINTTGGVDASLIARLTGRSKDEVSRELIDSRMAFKTRSGRLEAPETYLSGNVRAKLREAEALARNDRDFQNNVEELRRVIPKDVPYDEIHVSPGAVWIPTDVYADFIAHMLGGRNNGYGGPDVEVGYSAQTGEYKIRLNNARLKGNYHNTQEWGTSRRSFLDLFESLLGNGNVTVTDREIDANGKERRVVNKDETAAAQEKADKIKEEFRNWIWSDETRRTELAKLYNETYNALANPKYDGSSLTVNGLNATFSLREHQANAVKRIIASGGNTLLAHRVGAGKTLEMAAAAMKLRELGIVKKPVFAVPKSLVAQWGVEFNSYFPAAKLLVADDKSFSKENRKVFTNNIANGDFDAVILSYEQFGKIPMSKEYQQRFLQEQIDEVLTAIAEEKAENGKGSLTIKQMEKKAAQLKTKLERLKIQSVDEDNVDFESLGIDALFVDEAHNFKNLQYTTKMQNVGGLGNSDGSQRAFDLYTKIRYLQQLNGGRGIVFATATPVMNSMAEMYIMQKYLQSDMLKQLGITTFDAWAKQFGEVVNTYEIKPSGQGVRAKQVFSNFKNLNELQLMFRSFSDVLTEVPGLKIPKMRGGGVQIVECEPGKFQKEYMKSLEKRANNVKNVDPSEDNMLKITSDGRKVSYTQRMIDPTLPYEPGCKLYRCCENILKEYRDGKNIKTVDGKTGKKVTINGTQIVFCDMATPKGKDKSKANDDVSTEADDSFDAESARLYEDMRDYLAKKGIPRDEIAFIHEADTDLKRKQLFADMNAGKVRVLIGSTGKMGVGMNAQRCVTAIHHLDAPWRPGDVEQRDGRAFRQGNLNDEVAKYVYVTTGSFDARLWDILDRKSGFINQIMNGDDVGRNAEDTGDVTLSAAEVKALASGNPMIKESVELADELQKLNGLKRTHDSAVIRARTNLQNDIKSIASLEMSIEARKADLKKRTDTYSEEKFSMQIGGKTFSDRKDAGEALLSAILTNAKTENEYAEIGSFAGFQILAAKSQGEYEGVLRGAFRYGFKVHLNNPTLMAGQMAKKIAGLEADLKAQEELLAQTIADKAAQEKLIAQPFERQAELDEKRRRYDFVMSELNKTDQQYGADDAEQHQNRTNTLTDREILSMAADKILTNDAISMDAAESDALGIFKKRLKDLDSLQEQRRDLGKTYKEQQFGANVDRGKAAETLKQMRELDAKIQEAENKVIAAETSPALRKVLPVARRIVEQSQKALDDAVLQRWRDRRNNAAAIKKYRDRISKDVTDLTSWILSPSNKTDMKHVPDVLKNTVIEFINSIDFTSKRQLNGGEATQADIAFMNRLVALQRALDKNAEDTGLYSGYNDLPPGFHEKLKEFIASAQAIVNAKSGQSVINQMTSQELKALSEIVKALKKHIQDFNRFHANAVYQHVYDAGDATIRELNQYNDAKSRTMAGERINNFVFWNQIRPAYAFERFGNGGKAIYDGLRRGQAQLAFDTKEIVAFSEKAYTEKEVKDWEKEVKTIQLEEGTVKMRVSQIMSFYELLKREQAKGHIFGQGIRVSTFLANGKKVSDTGHTISIEDANRIVAELTPRQKDVADALQKYMQEKGGSWGNYVSVKRFGEKLFGEENYFPINSDGRRIEADADEEMEGQSLYALLNMGFTKKLQEKANNRIVVYSIFDVFSNHMASMAQYHAMALPVLDALKWFNYQQKERVTIIEDGKERVQNQVVDSVRDQLDRVFGVPEETKPGAGRRGYAENFIVGILKAFNGTETYGIGSDEIGLNALRHYNMAQVAYNLRVVVQQPMAITRAAMVIDYGSIIRGMKLSPKAIQKNIEEMNRYSGIAAWKDLGFYDTNISRGLTDIIKHNESFRDKLGDVGMWGAEKADQLTWAAMWSACKEEVQRKHGILPGNEHFYEAVSSLFEEVVYKTQVVDSVLTKNAFLRSKGFFARATGSFMSEPTATASMVVDAFDKYRMDLHKKGGNHLDALRKNGKRIGRMLYVYGLGAVVLAAVQAVADAFRDDDKYEKYADKWMEAFIGNFIDELMPFNKLPIVSDVYDLSKELLRVVGVDTYGNPPASVYMQWYDSLVKGTNIIYKKITKNENNKYTWFGGAFKLLQAVAGMTGLPIAAATREIVTIWNNTVGQMVPSYLIRSYEQKPETEIKYSFMDGYMTELEARNALVRDAGLSEEEAAQKAAVMAFRREYPEYADAMFSESSIRKYLDFCKPRGIAPGVCFDVIAYNNEATADKDENGNAIPGSKKKKVLDYINRQNLTSIQKDTLYNMFGWSSDTLKEDAPWH
ncbi:MAG: SNF2-related protein [Candidatus Faecousia sp.]|nr:SNF2-related protein [Candidatus Faecousia sp.]